MEPKIKAVQAESAPPSPGLVLLFSLFGYPGLGHYWVGSKKLGVSIALLFTALTLGILSEAWILGPPVYRLITEGTAMDVSPDWARIAFWVVSTGIVWLGSGLHSYFLAKAAVR